MKYKFMLFVVLSFMFVCCSSKKDLTERFKADITSYTEAYNKGEWNKVADLIYPKLYSVSSKEELIATMSSLDSMGMKTVITLNNIDKISEVFTHVDEKFCLIKYKTTLDITIEKSMIDKINELKSGFEAQFGKENIRFDEKLNKFNISATQTMVAISPKDKDEWKYIEHDESQPDYITKMIIPEEILKKFKK